jgi:hypothetical protein
MICEYHAVLVNARTDINRLYKFIKATANNIIKKAIQAAVIAAIRAALSNLDDQLVEVRNKVSHLFLFVALQLWHFIVGLGADVRRWTRPSTTMRRPEPRRSSSCTRERRRPPSTMLRRLMSKYLITYSNNC